MSETSKALGMASACQTCGGINKLTGKERLGPWQTAVDPGRFRMRLAEYACTACGRRDWMEAEMIEGESHT